MLKPKFFPFLISLIVILLMSCSSSQEGSPTDTKPSAQPTWQFRQGIQATGIVVLSKTFDLSFTLTGNLTELLVEQGDTISPGEVIARLDTSMVEQEIDVAQADLKVAQANLERVLVGPSQEELIQAQNYLFAAQNSRPLTVAQATIQAADINSAQARLDYLESLPLSEDVALAQAEVDRAQTRLDSAEARLEKSILTAPIDGSVIDVFIHAYEYAQAGQPVVRMSDSNDLGIDVWIDEEDVTGLSTGDEAKVTFDALPGVTAQAVIISFNPNLERNDLRDFKVELKLVDVPENLRWGMTAEVIFIQ